MLRRLLDPNGSGVLRLLAVIFGGVALILLVIAGGLALHTWSFLRDAETATGTVVGLVGRTSCSTDSDDRQTCSRVYAPRVRFSTADGREIEYVSSTASSPPSYHEGQQVEIRYQPDDPYDARIYGFVDLWMAAVIVGGIGVIFGLIAGGLVLIGRSLRPAPEPASGWQDPGTLR